AISKRVLIDTPLTGVDFLGRSSAARLEQHACQAVEREKRACDTSLTAAKEKIPQRAAETAHSARAEPMHGCHFDHVGHALRLSRTALPYGATCTATCGRPAALSPEP